MNDVVIWMKLAHIDTYVYIYGPQFIEPFGKYQEVWPDWRRSFTGGGI